MQTKGVYKDPKGEEHAVTMGAVNIIKYMEAGKNTISGISTWEINCKGETWKTPDGQQIDNAYVDVQLIITIEEETFLSNAEEVRSQRDKKLLPCSDAMAGCATATQRYVWEGKRETCNLACSREAEEAGKLRKITSS